MKKIFDDSLSIGRGFSRIHTRETPAGDWHDGEVATAHGFASVYAQSSYSRIDFVHAVRLHMRRIGKRLTPQGLARAAHKFAAHVVSSANPQISGPKPEKNSHE
mgnify:CR=1 FL=1